MGLDGMGLDRKVNISYPSHPDLSDFISLHPELVCLFLKFMIRDL